MARFSEHGSSSQGRQNAQDGQPYRIGDLVWARAQSHPWWPGQIYEPSLLKGSNKILRPNTLLVAFFGDKTYFGCKKEDLLPFEENLQNFSEQNTKHVKYRMALDDAVEELWKRKIAEKSEEPWIDARDAYGFLKGIALGVTAPPGKKAAALKAERFLEEYKSSACSGNALKAGDLLLDGDTESPKQAQGKKAKADAEEEHRESKQKAKAKEISNEGETAKLSKVRKKEATKSGSLGPQEVREGPSSGTEAPVAGDAGVVGASAAVETVGKKEDEGEVGGRSSVEGEGLGGDGGAVAGLGPAETGVEEDGGPLRGVGAGEVLADGGAGGGGDEEVVKKKRGRPRLSEELKKERGKKRGRPRLEEHLLKTPRKREGERAAKHGKEESGSAKVQSESKVEERRFAGETAEMKQKKKEKVLRSYLWQLRQMALNPLLDKTTFGPKAIDFIQSYRSRMHRKGKGFLEARAAAKAAEVEAAAAKEAKKRQVAEAAAAPPAKAAAAPPPQQHRRPAGKSRVVSGSSSSGGGEPEAEGESGEEEEESQKKARQVKRQKVSERPAVVKPAWRPAGTVPSGYLGGSRAPSAVAASQRFSFVGEKRKAEVGGVGKFVGAMEARDFSMGEEAGRREGGGYCAGGGATEEAEREREREREKERWSGYEGMLGGRDERARGGSSARGSWQDGGEDMGMPRRNNEPVLGWESDMYSGRQLQRPQQPPPDRPVALKLRFPSDAAMPTDAELAAQFVKYGKLHTDRTFSFYFKKESYVVYMRSEDAKMALSDVKKRGYQQYKVKAELLDYELNQVDLLARRAKLRANAKKHRAADHKTQSQSQSQSQIQSHSQSQAQAHPSSRLKGPTQEAADHGKGGGGSGPFFERPKWESAREWGRGEREMAGPRELGGLAPPHQQQQQQQPPPPAPGLQQQQQPQKSVARMYESLNLASPTPPEVVVVDPIDSLLLDSPTGPMYAAPSPGAPKQRQMEGPPPIIPAHTQPLSLPPTYHTQRPQLAYRFPSYPPQPQPGLVPPPPFYYNPPPMQPTQPSQTPGLTPEPQLAQRGRDSHWGPGSSPKPPGGSGPAPLVSPTGLAAGMSVMGMPPGFPTTSPRQSVPLGFPGGGMPGPSYLATGGPPPGGAPPGPPGQLANFSQWHGQNMVGNVGGAPSYEAQPPPAAGPTTMSFAPHQSSFAGSALVETLHPPGTVEPPPPGGGPMPSYLSRPSEPSAAPAPTAPAFNPPPKPAPEQPSAMSAGNTDLSAQLFTLLQQVKSLVDSTQAK